MEPVESGEGATGEPRQAFEILTITFDRYTVKVRVGSGGEFIDVIEVAVSKDFRTIQQRITSTGFHDVAEFYRDDDKDDE